MTTFEHALLGINGALATGLHRRFGWQIAAMAGVAAIAPDWDGFAILLGQNAFAEGHRLWGHNILACLIVGVLIGVVDYRFDIATRIGRRLMKITDPSRSQFSWQGGLVWLVVAILAALSQLPADLVVSGSASLPVWELRPFWPFSDRSFEYPILRWGDPTPTLIFIVGMFAMVRWKAHIQWIAAWTLIVLLLLFVARRAALI